MSLSLSLPPSLSEFQVIGMVLVYKLALLLSLLSLARCSCDKGQRDLLSLAFSSVSGFQPPTDDGPDCSDIREVTLPSRNLTGTVSWMFLRNISTLRDLDLSGNALEGSVPAFFWSAPSLAKVNLADNRLGGALRFERSVNLASGPHPLRSLNLSGNRFTSAAGLSRYAGIRVLDLSRNSLAGALQGVLPPLAGLRFLNVSYNNFTGPVDFRYLAKFGSSAFIKAGSLTFASSPRASNSAGSLTFASSPRASNSTTHDHGEKHKRKSRARALRWGLVAAASFVAGLALLGFLYFAWTRKRDRRKGTNTKSLLPSTQEAGWVAEARPGATVVVFEKPLMELTFADLAVATSGFGRESQLAESGRSGPAYRAVLPGDMHVVVRVLESARGLDEREAAVAFRELARLRHPNLLPLLGFCIAGREKLLLYEYMERGDLHRWLHELPSGKPDVEDWSGDTWEHHHHGEERRAAEVGDWPTRHRIALGVARGLAFLHQGWAGARRSVVHGHLVPSNVLLDDDLEPRVADLGADGVGTAEGDVYSYGLVVMELVTGRDGWSEGAVEWARGLVRAGRAAELVDPRLTGGSPEWDKEMVECLRVGYLCTAPSPEKRPTMQQVVGLLKDIRHPSTSTPTASSSQT